MAIFLRILAVVAFLIGALAGGCSLIASPFVFEGGGSDVLPIWLGGFALCAFLFWLGFLLWRRRD